MSVKAVVCPEYVAVIFSRSGTEVTASRGLQTNLEKLLEISSSTFARSVVLTIPKRVLAVLLNEISALAFTAP